MQDQSTRDPQLTAELVRDLIKEKRSDRRWKNIRFFLGFLVVVVIALSLFGSVHSPVTGEDDGKGYVALIRFNGMIGPGEDFSAENVMPVLKEAFTDKQAKGIVLEINSGGGTPVQASIIHDEIMRLKRKYHKKVVVVGEDMLASGAYYVAVASDKIYVNPNTITGSIGVIMRGFGFPELIKKIGIERRVFTAGVNKDRLDPFLPQNQEDIQKIQQVISEVHGNFQQAVVAGRQGKLHGETSVLFSGDFWSGPTALKLGLVDGLGNLSDVLTTEFNVSRYKDYSQSQSVMKAILGRLSTSLNTVIGSNQQVGLLEKL
jgi:protease IV